MSVASSSSLHTRTSELPSITKPFSNHQFNVVSLGRVRVARAKRSSVLEKRFYGTRVRALSGEKLHLWRSDGPGRDPKLRMVVRSALSQVPQKPLGLYDPAFDKDSCGVGFVAELSGESSRKTVRINTVIRFFVFWVFDLFFF